MDVRITTPSGINATIKGTTLLLDEGITVDTEQQSKDLNNLMDAFHEHCAVRLHKESKTIIKVIALDDEGMQVMIEKGTNMGQLVVAMKNLFTVAIENGASGVDIINYLIGGIPDEKVSKGI